MIYVRNILYNNFFPLQLSSDFQEKDKKHKNTKNKQKWVACTFFGKEANYIAKPFKKTDLNVLVAYKTKSSIHHLLKPKYLTKKEERASTVMIYIS
jgi:hypothetical protein